MQHNVIQYSCFFKRFMNIIGKQKFFNKSGSSASESSTLIDYNVPFKWLKIIRISFINLR